MDVLVVILVSFAGGLLSILAGWLNAGGAFDWRKFLYSMIRTLIAAVSSAVAFNYTTIGVTPLSLAAAFMGAISLDVLGNRLAGGATNLKARYIKFKLTRGQHRR